MLESQLKSLNPLDWEYLGEGNANLVLKYNGKGSGMEGKCLRLTKVILNVTIAQRLNYQEEVVKELFGSEYSPECSLVVVTREFLQSISIKIESKRPEERRSKTINLDVTTAVLMTNLAYGNDIAIEIKPKWGFSPYSLSCRFCLHQKLRSSKDDQYIFSTYCPLDLFSKDHFRILKAIRALFESPKNNLKIHSNLMGLDNDQLQLVLKSVIGNTNILERLQQFQLKYHQDVDLLDLKKTCEEYDNLFVTNAKNTIHYQGTETHNVKNANFDNDYKLARMMLSVALKDLSLFITLKAIPPDAPLKTNQIEWNSIKLQLKITIIDLDFKSCKKLEKLKYLESQLSGLLG